MNISHVEAAIEAILFSSGDPVPIDRLAETLDIDKQTVQKILTLMIEKREAENFGVKIIKINDCCQMVTKPEFAPQIRRIMDIKRNIPLSNAAMETLAIIAYNQPVTKGYIEQVRGVDSGGVVSSLVSKQLVEERGRLDVPGRPILYGTTLNFLRCFGLKSINDLPEIKDTESINEAPENAG
jgi:segregation and condensation protein B